jgi:hypothetical protein
MGDIFGGVGKWGGSDADHVPSGVILLVVYLNAAICMCVCVAGCKLVETRTISSGDNNNSSNINEKRGSGLLAHHHLYVCVKLYTKIRLKNQDFPRTACITIISCQKESVVVVVVVAVAITVSAV